MATSLLLLLTAYGCELPGPPPAAAQTAEAQSAGGPFATPALPGVRIHHVDLDLQVDFDARRVSGRARVELLRFDRAAPLRLDVGPAIDRLQVRGPDGAARPISLVPGGAAVDLRPDDQALDLSWIAGPASLALQWLPGTARGDRPFLQALGRAGIGRDWLPLQDHPAVRCTWSVEVRTPADSVAVMSTPDRELLAPGHTRFGSPRRLAVADLALLVGDLARHSIGPDCSVWSRPSDRRAALQWGRLLETALWIATSSHGPNPWGRCDVVMRPAAADPDLVTLPGLCLCSTPPPDRTRDAALDPLLTTSRAAAAQWTRHLVTPIAWDELWLGAAQQSRLATELFRATAGAAAAASASERERHRLLQALTRLSPAEQILLPEESRRDQPRTATAADFASAKATALLNRCEQLLGPGRLDRFLDDWADRYAQRGGPADAFRMLLEAEFAPGARADPAFDLAEWFTGTGLPADLPAPTSSLPGR